MILHAEQLFHLGRRQLAPVEILRHLHDAGKAAVLFRAAHDVLGGVLRECMRIGHGLVRAFENAGGAQHLNGRAVVRSRKAQVLGARELAPRALKRQI